MSLTTLRILSRAWVTPLGNQLERVREAILRDARPAPSDFSAPWNQEKLPYYALPAESSAELGRLPRLRRASGISFAAVAAAQQCLERTAQPMPPADRRTVLFAASDGSVHFTRRFFAGVAESGPAAGSPLLFPETVFNAPASHLCATLGWTGEALSLVGDGCSSLQAAALAANLLHTDRVDLCLLVAAQEADPISIAAYGAWGIRPPKTLFSEGAGALVLAREELTSGGVRLRVHPGLLRQRGDSIAALLRRLAQDLQFEDGSEAVGVLSGTSAAAPEFRAAEKLFPQTRLLQPRRSLGEALCASTLWQVILAAEILQSRTKGFRRAFVPVVGYQGQVSAAVLEVASP